MSDLEAIQAEAIPRSDALCRRLGNRIDALWGFIAYGVLWIFAAGVISVFVMIASIWLLSKNQGPSPVNGNIVLVVWVLSFALAWVPFGRWVVRRRAAARHLFQHGVLMSGVVHDVTRLSLRGAPFTTGKLRFEAEGKERHATFSTGGHPVEISEGGEQVVLFETLSRHCAFFPIAGGVVAAHMR